MSNLVYRVSLKFFLTSSLTKKIQHKISLIYPSTKFSIIKKTGEYLIRIYVLSLLVTFGMFIFSEFSFYYSCLVVIVIYAMMNSHINTDIAKQELKLISYLDEFITEVHFNYQFNKMIEDSIDKAINKVPYEMAIHGEILLDFLKKAYRNNDEDYRDIVPNKLFHTFYSLSLTVLVYGDKLVENQSLFLKNLGHLKEDIHIEILKQEKIINQFMGLFAVTLLPVFSIKAIEAWAISNLPELTDSYLGIEGKVTTIILSLVTIFIYKIITILKSPNYFKEYKSKWPEKMLENKIINYFVILFIKKTFKMSEKMDTLLKSIVYPYNIKEFIIRRFSFSFLIAILSFLVSLSIGFDFIVSFFIGVILSITFYAGYYMKIILIRQILIMDREEEIVRFQSIILMLMHIDKISVEQILRQISDFAVVFKNEMNEIINQMSGNGMKTIKQIKEKTGFLPFEKLMDNFLACDAVEIVDAFSGIEVDRSYYVEKHKQENENIISKKASIAKFIAFIPLCLVIIVKLILPFVLEGIGKISNIEF